MVCIVVIVPVVDDDLVETGKPCPIYLLSRIVFICHTNQFYQFLCGFWSGVIEALDGSEEAQVQ